MAHGVMSEDVSLHTTHGPSKEYKAILMKLCFFEVV